MHSHKKFSQKAVVYATSFLMISLIVPSIFAENPDLTLTRAFKDKLTSRRDIEKQKREEKIKQKRQEARQKKDASKSNEEEKKDLRFNGPDRQDVSCGNIMQKMCDHHADVCTKIDDVLHELEEHHTIINSKIDALECIDEIDLGCDVCSLLDELGDDHYKMMENQYSIFDRLNDLCLLSSLVHKVETVDSKVDVLDTELACCCATMNSKLDIIDAELGEHHQTVNSKLDNLLDEIEAVESSLDMIEDKAYTIDSKVDVIDRLHACGPIPITQDDVPASGILILNTLDPNNNYCLVEDLVATISLTIDNSCLCLNCHKLTGRIIIDAQNITVKNGSIMTPEPVDNQESLLAAVDILRTGTKAHLLHLCIMCQDSPDGLPESPRRRRECFFDAIDGRVAVHTQAPDTFIKDCTIKAGSGGNGATDPNCYLGGNGGRGGDGIRTTITAPGLQVECSSVEAGHGGNGAPGMAAGDNDCGGNGGRACDGGNAITSHADDVTVKNSNLKAGHGGHGGRGGNGGDVCDCSQCACLSSSCDTCCNHGDGACDCSICDCLLSSCSSCCGPDIAGNGGQGGDGGNGGHGIENRGSNTFFVDTTFIDSGHGGNGAHGGNGNTGGAGGFGGHGGDGIRTCAHNGLITNNVIKAFSGANGGCGGLCVGDKVKGGDGGKGGNGGVGVKIAGDPEGNRIRHNAIDATGNGGDAGRGAACPDAISGLDGTIGLGGHGIEISAAAVNTEITGNSIANTGLDGMVGGCPRMRVLCSSSGGKAINDMSPTSVVFGNFAYNIANCALNYTVHGLTGEAGVAMSVCHDQHDNIYDDEMGVGGIHVVCSKLSVLESKVDVVDNELEACCLTVNSKLDELFEDFRETWTVLDEMQGLLSSKIEKVENDLAGHHQEVLSDFRGTWTALANLESKIDFIINSL